MNSIENEHFNAEVKKKNNEIVQLKNENNDLKDKQKNKEKIIVEQEKVIAFLEKKLSEKIIKPSEKSIKSEPKIGTEPFEKKVAMSLDSLGPKFVEGLDKAQPEKQAEISHQAKIQELENKYQKEVAKAKDLETKMSDLITANSLKTAKQLVTASTKEKDVRAETQKSLDEILNKLNEIKLKKFQVPGLKENSTFNAKMKETKDIIKLLEDEKLATEKQIHERIARVKAQVDGGFLEENDDPSCLYDVVIKTTTFHKLLQGSGWKVLKNLDRMKNINMEKGSVKVNMMGNYNKGKTHILSFLSGRPLPYGHNVHTKGISCIYPPSKEQLITFLDSAGFDEPAKHVKFLEKLREKRNQIDKKLITEADVQKTNDLKEDAEIISKFLKDKMYTEHCIQNFLLEKADVFMLVVGQLTNTDQKLIQRIIEKHSDKRIYVIHNFYNLRYKSDVEKHINKDIKSSFSVEEKVYASPLDETHNRIFWVDKANPEFIHVVMAQDDSEAGRYYNAAAKEMMLNSIKDKSNNQKKFQLEESLHQYINEKLPNYLQTAAGFTTILEKDETNTANVDHDVSEEVKVFDGLNNNNTTTKKNTTDKLATTHLIKKKQSQEVVTPIEFRPAMFNQYGYLEMYQSQTLPTNLVYDLYEMPDELILKAELPGVSEEHLKITPVFKDEFFHFEITIERPKNPENSPSYYENSIKTGTIPFKTKSLRSTKILELEGGNITASAMTLINGVLVMKWKKREVLTEPLSFTFKKPVAKTDEKKDKN